MMIKRVFSRLTMKRETCAFIDKVDGCEVFYYRDYYGNRWLANFNYLLSARAEISND